MYRCEHLLLKTGLEIGIMNQKELSEKQKEFRRWLDETLPNPTPEQLSQLDERGDWIRQPDSQGTSTVEQEAT